MWFPPLGNWRCCAAQHRISRGTRINDGQAASCGNISEGVATGSLNSEPVAVTNPSQGANELRPGWIGYVKNTETAVAIRQISSAAKHRNTIGPVTSIEVTAPRRRGRAPDVHDL